MITAKWHPGDRENVTIGAHKLQRGHVVSRQPTAGLPTADPKIVPHRHLPSGHFGFRTHIRLPGQRRAPRRDPEPCSTPSSVTR